MEEKNRQEGYSDALRSLLEAVSVFEEGDQERGLLHLLGELTMIGNSLDLEFRDDVRDLRALFNVFRKEVIRITDGCIDKLDDGLVAETIEKWRTWRKESPVVQAAKDFIAELYLEEIDERDED